MTNKAKNDPIADFIEQIEGPSRAWDKSLAIAGLLKVKRPRKIEVSSEKEGWKIRDILNEIGVKVWFPKPGKTTGLIVHYHYKRDITAEEIEVLVENNSEVNSDEVNSDEVSEEPPATGTTVQRTSE